MLNDLKNRVFIRSILQSLIADQHHKNMKKFIVTVIIAKTILLLSFYLAVFAPYPLLNKAEAQTPAKPTPTPENANTNIDHPTSDPYVGNLDIFEDEKRAERLQINRVMEILKITEGKTVADVGAGSGWFTVRAAKLVSNKGCVYAVDINPESIKYIDERAVKENLPQIKTILSKEDDPLLPEKSVDAVLLLKTYHEIADPIRLMQNLAKSLKKDALVGIIDKNGRGDDHGLDKEKVVSEAKRAGFELVGEYDFVKSSGIDYFLVFGKSK